MANIDFINFLDKAFLKWNIKNRLDFYRHSYSCSTIDKFYFKYGFTSDQIINKIKSILYGRCKPTKEEYSLLKSIFIKFDNEFGTSYNKRLYKFFNKKYLKSIKNSKVDAKLSIKSQIDEIFYESIENKNNIINSKLFENSYNINYIPELKDLIESYLVKNRNYDGNAMGFIKNNYNQFELLHNYHAGNKSTNNRKSIIRWSQKVLRGEILINGNGLVYFYSNILKTDANFIQEMDKIIRHAVSNKKWNSKSYAIWKDNSPLPSLKSFVF